MRISVGPYSDLVVRARSAEILGVAMFSQGRFEPLNPSDSSRVRQVAEVELNVNRARR